MKYQKLLIKIFVFSLMAALITMPAFAESIKERMKQRLPAIMQLKAKGIVGENNQGFLAFVNGNQGPSDVVTQENQDREIVYTKIAQQQNTNASLVGQRRAIQLFDLAKSGEFVQKPDGSWLKKP